MIDLDEYTDLELGELAQLIAAEQKRRGELSNIESAVVQALSDYRRVLGITDGDEYHPPTSYLDAYGLGNQVTYGGVLWEALRNGATGAPGESSDWKRVLGPGEEPPWFQPWAGGEWDEGVIVHHEGRRWRNDLGSSNGFVPGAPHSGWTDLGPIDGGEPEPEPEPGVEAWSQPQAPGYAVGVIVSHAGRVWRNDHSTFNGFTPGVAHSGWTDLGPVG